MNKGTMVYTFHKAIVYSDKENSEATSPERLDQIETVALQFCQIDFKKSDSIHDESHRTQS